MKLNPWIHYNLLGFGIFNCVMGIILFFYYPSIPLTVISSSIPQIVWALLFIGSGIVTLIGIRSKWLYTLRYVMSFNLFVKMMWEVGLLLRIAQGGNLFIASLWAMVAFEQFLVVIFFNPIHYERI